MYTFLEYTIFSTKMTHKCFCEDEWKEKEASYISISFISILLRKIHSSSENASNLQLQTNFTTRATSSLSVLCENVICLFFFCLYSSTFFILLKKSIFLKINFLGSFSKISRNIIVNFGRNSQILVQRAQRYNLKFFSRTTMNFGRCDPF